MKQLDRLLNGDTTVAVRSFTISGQQESNKVIDDPQAVEYLTNAIRRAKAGGRSSGRQGYAYTLTLHFAPFQGASTDIITSGDDAKGFTLGQYSGGLFGDNDYYWVGFDEPIPASITRTFDQIRDAEKKFERSRYTPTSQPAPSSKSK